MSSNGTYVAQEGGDHYQASTQHWDIAEEFDLAYLEGTATKYLCRWARKGTPEQDLRKAITYLDKMVACGRTEVLRRVPWNRLTPFMDDLNLGRRTRRVLILILINGMEGDLKQAVSILTSMANALKDGASPEAVDA